MEKGWRMAKKPFFLDKFQSHEKNRKKGFMLHCIGSADSFVQHKNRRIGRFLYYGFYSLGQKGETATIVILLQSTFQLL